DGLVQRFHALAERLDDIRSGVDFQLRDVTTQINSLAINLAAANEAVAREKGSFSGQSPNDLLDQRDQLIRDLSELLDLSTVEQDDGSLNVFIGSGQGLVVGSRAVELTLLPSEFDPTDTQVGFGVGGSAIEITDRLRGGALGGILEFRSQVLGSAQSSLGQIAMGLARTVNDQHVAGQTLLGQSGGLFFAELDQTAAAVFPRSTNAGVPSAELSVSVSDVGTLAQSDFLLERTGAAHTLTRLSDGSVFSFAAFPGAAEEVDGIRFGMTSGAIADGDSFLIQPTRFAARALSVVPKVPSDIAAAAPVRATSTLTNLGDAVISPPSVNLPSHELTITFGTPPTTYDVLDVTTGATVLADVTFVSGGSISVNGLTTSITGAPVAGDVFTINNTVTGADSTNGGGAAIDLATVASPDPNLRTPVTITFTSATTFDVTGAATGTPTTGVSFVSGAPISFNGWTLDIAGTPSSGDVFSVGPNTGGVGDNRNALALAGLQTKQTLDQERSTYEDLYGQLVVRIGADTRKAEMDQSARTALHNQLVAERESISGVNLDEEAADLLRFQQAFQASAQLISVSEEIFAALLGAVRG
ncbi:MAG: flagellar hook-associated protein 1 FlgK, partial [Gammaproteobacteria bacterium]